MSTMPWTPGALTNPVKLWLDDSSPMDSVDGACSSWSSKVGDFRFVQATASLRPSVVSSAVAGARALVFDGVDDYLSIQGTGFGALLQNSGAAWLFSVYQKTTADTTGRTHQLFYADSASAPNRFAVGIGHASATNAPFLYTRRVDANTTAGLYAPASSVAGAWAMNYSEMAWSTGAASIYVDGALVASNAALTTAGVSSNTASTTMLIGSNNTASADMPKMRLAALIVGGGSVPSLDERRRLEGWAAHRYGLQSNLASDHPYRYTAPTMELSVGDGFASKSGDLPNQGRVYVPQLARRWSVEHGGNGRIYGNTVEYIAPEVDLNYPCRVRLVRDFDGVQIAEQWSKADGSFDFTWIDQRWTYTVLAYDPVRNYRAVVADGVTPEAMLWQ